MAWLENLSAERRTQWVQMAARVNALLDDLEAIRLNQSPLSVPGESNDRVLAWAETEKINLDNFGDQVLFEQSELNPWDGFFMRWDIGKLKDRIDLAALRAEATVVGDATNQDLDPTIVDPTDRSPLITKELVILGVIVFGVLSLGGIAILRG